MEIKENPEGVSWPINPSFPLKANDSEPEGEAWVGRSPLPRYPEGVAYTPTPTEVKVQPLRGSWLRLSLFPTFSSAGTLCIPTEGEGWVNRPWKPFGLRRSTPIEEKR